MISAKEHARYFGGMEEAKVALKMQASVDHEIGDQVKASVPFFGTRGWPRAWIWAKT